MTSMNIDRIMNSTTRRKIIAFFHENPSTVDTCDGIAKWIGEDVGKVRKSLKELVGFNILVAHDGIAIGYGYTQDNDMLFRIGIFLKKKGEEYGRRQKIAKTSAYKFSEDKN